MMLHLGKGFWFMRGVPGKQDPMGDKTLELVLGLLGNLLSEN